MWSIWRDATLQYCEEWMETYRATLLDAPGSGPVISISGGGESETRSDQGASQASQQAMYCRRRMTMLDPVKYPPIARRQKADFSNLAY